MASRLTIILVATIVAATLIAGLIVGAQKDDNQPVDLLVYNGKVFTGSGSDKFAEAVAVRGNRIVRVGTNRELKRLRRPHTTVIDAHGAAVLPGFNDAHVHFVEGGLALERVNLIDLDTIDAIETALREFVDANPDRRWVIGGGWSYESFPGGLPTREMLDAIVPDRPAYLEAQDGRAAWVNTRALELAGIAARSPNPPDGTIVRGTPGGEPTGVVKGSARDLVATIVPAPTREDRLRAVRAATHEAHRFGVTSVQDAGADEEQLELYDELRRSGELKVRVYSAISAAAVPTDADLARFDGLLQRFPDDPLLKTGAVELVVEGVTEPQPAVVPTSQPAVRPAARRERVWNAADLDRAVAALDSHGWQLMIHATDGAGVRMGLDAIERLATLNPAPARGRRHRIEHVERADADDIPRFAKLGVIASMLPFQLDPRQEPIDGAAAVESDRNSPFWLGRSIHDAGGRLAFGSDWPLLALDPRLGVSRTVNGVTPEALLEEGRDEGSFANEALPLAAALEAYTSGAAWASFDEHRKGRIAPDMLADLVILSSDIFTDPPSRLLDAVVTTTIFDGKVVYEHGGT